MITYRWYRNALPEGACDLFRTIGENKNLEEALTKQGVSKYRNSSVSFFNSVETRIIQDNVLSYINSCNIECNWNFELDFLEDVQFTIYNSSDNQRKIDLALCNLSSDDYKDGYYDWHKDWCCRDCSRDSEGNESILKGPRKLSCSILLSSPDEYEGGEFQIVNGDISRLEDGVFLKSDNVNIINKGDMVIFRSDVFHRILPVTKGVRKSLVLWFSGPEIN